MIFLEKTVNSLLTGYILIITSCTAHNNERSLLMSTASLDTITHQLKDSALRLSGRIKLIDGRYLKDQPVAALINMPDYSNLSAPFALQKNAEIQVYAVGEMMTSLSRIDKKYYFGNDDLEMYFHLGKKYSCNGKKEILQYIFTWVEGYTGGINSTGKGIQFDKSIDSAHGKYHAFLKFPWKNLGYLKPRNGDKIGFDLALADNDDGLRQKGKIAWNSEKDSMDKNAGGYGQLVLCKKNMVAHSPGYLYSLRKTSAQFPWDSIAFINAVKVIAGTEFKDISDCSARIKSCWDEKNLYFLIEISDGGFYYKERYITRKKRDSLRTFFDYGWIENEKGETVWEMNAQHATYAGGALKNQMFDSVLHLKAGRYTLRFTTDESHSYDNWDDNPPETAFYGIVLYNFKD